MNEGCSYVHIRSELQLAMGRAYYGSPWGELIKLAECSYIVQCFQKLCNI